MGEPFFAEGGSKFRFVGEINIWAPLITHRAASDEKIFRQSKQKAARIVDPIRRIFVTNDGKDSVDS
ncbi:MAG: hypothetical protein IKM33_01920, partial [Clostridia bacterium]|nr:hypothetical protein [Clostridia bacterium]